MNKSTSGISDFSNLSPEELQYQYSTRAQIPDFAETIARWESEATEHRSIARAILDIPYGETSSERLDLFLPAEETATALIVFIRGGYWRSLDKSTFSRFASAYTSHGASVAVVNYGHAPDLPLPMLVEQVRGSVEWLYRNASLALARPQPITVVAHSAGGHLGAMMLATDWSSRAADLPRDLIRGAVLVSGIYDLRPLVGLEFVNKDLRLDEEAAAALSPAFMAPSTTAPLYLAAGTAESDAFRYQTRLLAKQWEKNLVGHTELNDVHHLASYEQMCIPGSILHSATLQIAGLCIRA